MGQQNCIDVRNVWTKEGKPTHRYIRSVCVCVCVCVWGGGGGGVGDHRLMMKGGHVGQQNCYNTLSGVRSTMCYINCH